MENTFTAAARELHAQGKVSAAALAYVLRVIANGPARTVENRSGKNALFDFCSRKMGVTIGLESTTVEAAYCWILEFDPSVLGFWGQPEKIPLRLKNRNGVEQLRLRTFDFLVLQKDGLTLVECKNEEWLEKTAHERPDLAERRTDGSWHSPAIAPQIEQLGLRFRYISGNTISQALVRNLSLLSGVRLAQYSTKAAERCLQEQVGTLKDATLSQVLSKPIGFGKDDVYIALLRGAVFADLESDLLSAPVRTRIFLTWDEVLLERTIRAASTETKVTMPRITAGMSVLLDSRSFRVVLATSEKLELLDERGELLSLTSSAVLQLYSRKQLSIPEVVIASAAESEVAIRSSVQGASTNDFQLASQRAQFVEAWSRDRSIRPEKFGLKPAGRRQRFRWKLAYDLAKRRHGNGIFGLFPRVRKDRESGLPAPTVEEMRAVANELYFTPECRSIAYCYRELTRRAAEKSLYLPSRKSFSYFIHRARNAEEATLPRKGSRAAYSVGGKHASTENWLTAPDFPTKYAQADNTQLDLELVDSLTGKTLGRPWLSHLHSPYLHAQWSFFLSFDPPTAATTMQLLREAYARWGFLPASIGFDGGHEFDAECVDRLLAAFSINKVNRVRKQCRSGSGVESSFNRVHEEFIWDLRGNTKSRKEVRKITAEIDPSTTAAWTLPRLHEALERYYFDVVWETIAPELGCSPREALQEKSKSAPDPRTGMALPEDVAKLIFLPHVPRREVKVQPGRGIYVFGIYYWNELFRSPKFEGTRIETKYDPFDLARVYVYIDHQWRECRASHLPPDLHFTQKQLRIAAAEQREINKRYPALRDRQRGAALAALAKNTRETEVLLAQKRKDAEMAALRSPNPKPPKPKTPTQLKNLDFGYLKGGCDAKRV